MNMRRSMKSCFILCVLWLICVTQAATTSAQPVSEAERAVVEAQVHTTLGLEYHLQDIIDVEASLRTGGTRTRPFLGPIEDPNGVLAGTYVFTAKKPGAAASDAIGVVGVSSGGQIRWHSGSLITGAMPVAYGEIYAIKDLDRDAVVEIMVSWSYAVAGNYAALWIFSWNGTAGLQKNAVDENGYSKITSAGGAIYDFADLEGDGIWEVQTEPGQVSVGPLRFLWRNP